MATVIPGTLPPIVPMGTEQNFITGMVDAFQPVTARRAGLQNEGAAIDLNAHYGVETLAIPTLVVHARDDQSNPFSFGAYTAQHIPGGQFFPLETGGHLLLGHHADVRAQVRMFLQQATLE